MQPPLADAWHSSLTNAYICPKLGPVKKYMASTSQNPLATAGSAAHVLKCYAP